MNLDVILAELKKKEAAIAAAIEEFNAEQAAGRLGLEPYERAKLLVAQHDGLANGILLKLDDLLKSL